MLPFKLQVHPSSFWAGYSPHWRWRCIRNDVQVHCCNTNILRRSCVTVSWSSVLLQLPSVQLI